MPTRHFSNHREKIYLTSKYIKALFNTNGLSEAKAPFGASVINYIFYLVNYFLLQNKTIHTKCVNQKELLSQQYFGISPTELCGAYFWEFLQECFHSRMQVIETQAKDSTRGTQRISQGFLFLLYCGTLGFTLVAKSCMAQKNGVLDPFSTDFCQSMPFLGGFSLFTRCWRGLVEMRILFTRNTICGEMHLVLGTTALTKLVLLRWL